ncbi:hypothetical protein LCGC14_1576640 [marine sediment metagenome]|uniref:Uncharacterized protein n=1 Tax=marine sediment metagenome TaxID=412755 RepID=A0A0F9LIB0_9ZZZZ
MKAREVRERLHGKVEPELIVCVCGIAESLSSQQQEIKALAEMLDKTVDLLMQLGVTIEGTQNAVDRIQKIRGEHD